MFDNVLPAVGTGVQMITGTHSHWYDLTSLWYDLIAFTAMALWAVFRSTARAWNLSPVPQDPDRMPGDPR